MAIPTGAARVTPPDARGAAGGASGARFVCADGAIISLETSLKQASSRRTVDRMARPLLAVGLSLLCGCSDPAPAAAPVWRDAFAPGTSWLMNVWGPAPDALYAVGGRPAAGVIFRFDGSAWARVDPGLTTPLLNWVYGFSRADVTVVGNGGTVIHWDGRAWSRQPTPTTRSLWGVWGAAPDDLWAVGGDGVADAPPVLLHWDGGRWRDEPIPTLQRSGVGAFFKVWGTGADNVYVVGQRGVVLHRVGGAWREELVGVSADLVSVWGTDADHVLAVGGRANAVVARWDGRAWTARTLDYFPGLNGVWMRRPDAAHVVGAQGTSLRIDLASLAVREETVPTALDLHAVFGDASGRLTAVGGSLSSLSGPFDGVALTRPLTPQE